MDASYCVQTLFVMVAFGMFALCVPLVSKLAYRCLRKQGWSKRRLEKLANREVRLLLMLFTIVHAPLTMRLLKCLNCNTYGTCLGK